MKSLSLIAACAMLASTALGQGTVKFLNRDLSLNFDQPVFDVDGTKLGDAYVAQLLGGPSESALAPIGNPVAFRPGTGAGYWNPGADSTRTIPGVAGDATGTFQVWAWESKYATLDAAMAAGGKWGKSEAFTNPTGGGGTPPSLPVTISNFKSFSLIPEPSTLALGLIGATLLVYRRRK